MLTFVDVKNISLPHNTDTFFSLNSCPILKEVRLTATLLQNNWTPAIDGKENL